MLERPNIRDVARRSGYSSATVSLALRDHPHLPEATRVLIQQTARKMGYRPDPVMASVAAHRWQRHARLSGEATLAVIVEKMHLEGSMGLKERAARLGYGFEVFQIREYQTGQRLAEVLYNRGILGVLVSQIFTPGFFDSFDWSHFSAVAVSEGAFRPPIHLVMPNHAQAVQVAWDHAVQQGFRRVGMVIFDQPYALDFHDRRAAYIERQLQVPANSRLPLLTLPPQPKNPRRRDEVRRRIAAWAPRYRPDVVLGFNDGIIWDLLDADARVPEDFAFISLWNQGLKTDPAGMVLAADEVGRRAVDWVDSLMRAGERGLPRHPSTMLVDFEWQDGTDAACVKTRRRPAASASDSAPVNLLPRQFL